MTSLDIGWSEARAAQALGRFKSLYGFNLLLQSFIALMCVIAPLKIGAWLTGLPAGDAVPFLPVWGGMVLLASALQFFAWQNPIHQRMQIGIAILGRFVMVAIYIVLGGVFWRFALFDGVFAIALALFLHRALIAELQTRP